MTTVKKLVSVMRIEFEHHKQYGIQEREISRLEKLAEKACEHLKKAKRARKAANTDKI